MNHEDALHDNTGIPAAIAADMREILAYLWDDEAASYLESWPLEGRRNHIFTAVLLVDAWLARQETTKP